MAQNGITYVLNASNTCPKPEFISESHFMRIPVNDNYCEKLLPWLDKTNEFIGKEMLASIPEMLIIGFFGLSIEEVFSYLACFVFTYTFSFFLSDKAKVSNCRVIVHCLAGISRSATIAIAYIMKTMGLSSDDAYR